MYRKKNTNVIWKTPLSNNEITSLIKIFGVINSDIFLFLMDPQTLNPLISNLKNKKTTK
jgi:hypothetical protein